MLAASLSGITLANAGLGAVHGLAGPTGAFFEAPHGAVCALLLAPITQANIDALQQSNEPHAKPTLAKYADIAILFGSTASHQVKQLQDLVDHLQRLAATYIPNGLRHYGLSETNLSPILDNCRSGSMLGNPLTLSDSALKSALNSAL